MTTVVYLGIAATATASCVVDLRWRRIPNSLTLGSAAAGWCVHAAASGPGGAAFSLAGFAIGLALFLPWFLIGAMGGGDVKLLGAFGAWLGPAQIVWACLFAMAAGGVLAAIILAAKRRSSPRAMAYALPVAVGVGLAVWLH